MFVLAYLQSALSRFLGDERGQDAFEYLLVIGGVSVFVIVAMTAIGWNAVVSAVMSGVCDAIATIDGFGLVDC